jgi:hypothetical protein
MSLISRVIEYVNRVNRNPTLGSDPGELDALMRAARSDEGDSFSVLASGKAPLSWEERVILLSGDGSSERVAFKFPYAMEVVGMFPVIEPILPAQVGLVAPSIMSVDVQIDINNQNMITNLEGVSTTAAGANRGGNFVTLAGISSAIANRMIALKLESPSPELGMTFRWKQMNVYQDVIVGVQLFVRELDDGKKSSNVPNAARGGYR